MLVLPLPQGGCVRPHRWTQPPWGRLNAIAGVLVTQGSPQGEQPWAGRRNTFGVKAKKNVGGTQTPRPWGSSEQYQGGAGGEEHGRPSRTGRARNKEEGVPSSSHCPARGQPRRPGHPGWRGRTLQRPLTSLSAMRCPEKVCSRSGPRSPYSSARSEGRFGCLSTRTGSPHRISGSAGPQCPVPSSVAGGSHASSCAVRFPLGKPFSHIVLNRISAVPPGRHCCTPAAGISWNPLLQMLP